MTTTQPESPTISLTERLKKITNYFYEDKIENEAIHV
jgi:hypothetical protein